MLPREIGDATALYAREMNLADEIARMTSVTPSIVRRRLGAAHGRTLVRTIFETEWPPPLAEIGLSYVRDATGRGFVSSLADVVGLHSAEVVARLGRAAPNETVRSVFASEWFDPSKASLSDFATTTVNEARALGFLSRIVELIGLDTRVASRRLAAAHGKTLVRNVFEREWPEDVAKVPPPNAATKHPGDLIASRYELVRCLGRGGFGEAWKARDQRAPGKPERVLKFATEAPESLESLHREMEKAFDLTHPNICKLCDLQADSAHGTFLVYAFGGESLTQVLARRGALPVNEAMRITREVAAGLDYAHASGVIHHDVNPGNILLDAKGIVRLTDFGVAKRAIARQTTGGSKTMVATSTSVAFHRCYVAPEVLARGEAQPASDQYTLALVLCSMLEGQVFSEPYAGHPFPQLSVAQRAALERALDMDPHDRFPSCGDFARALSS
jgi:hypothetical protein